MLLTENEISWISKYYPGLKVDKILNKVSGLLEFDMFYDIKSNRYIINPKTECIPNNMRIKDGYNIEICFNKDHELNLPIVRETGERIKKIVERRKLNFADLHINTNGEACLCFEFEQDEFLSNSFKIEKFFFDLLIPFFYTQSFFEKNNSWPWNQYSHGELGVFEWYLENKNELKIESINRCIAFLKSKNLFKHFTPLLLQQDNIKGHHKCICGSNKKFRNCHEKVFMGLWELRKDINSFSIKFK